MSANNKLPVGQGLRRGVVTDPTTLKVCGDRPGGAIHSGNPWPLFQLLQATSPSWGCTDNHLDDILPMQRQ